MKSRQGHATWLELVSIGHSLGEGKPGEAQVRLIARRLPSNGPCAALELTVDGRPLISNGGQRTVFCNEDAARRFLALARIQDYQLSESEAGNAHCYHGSAHCLTLSRNGLGRCTACAAARKDAHAA